MPELPEVESVRRLMRGVLGGRKIAEATVAPDEIVLSGVDPAVIEERLVGSRVTDVGRKGKFWWLELEERPYVFGHLGMSGWIREHGNESRRLHSHGDAPLDNAEGEPRFLKLSLTTDEGRRIVFTDGRRLARLWMAEGPETDRQVQRLGFDVFDALPDAEELQRVVSRRKAPIKAVLLDQSTFAGVGNWIADEVLYQAGIDPKRLGNTLTPAETGRLREALVTVVAHAVEVDVDYNHFPDSWLFHHRWGGNRGAELIDGEAIVRETVAGRTTAWVPTRQR